MPVRPCLCVRAHQGDCNRGVVGKIYYQTRCKRFSKSAKKIVLFYEVKIETNCKTQLLKSEPTPGPTSPPCTGEECPRRSLLQAKGI